MTQRKKGKPMKASMRPGYFKRSFGSKDFVKAILELVKNTRDWHANLVQIFTDVRTQFRIVDNGDGMNEDNRSSFFAVNDSRADGKTQSGKFGTGRNHFFYAFCTHVHVRTAPRDEPDWVYEFDFSTDHFEDCVINQKSLIPDVVRKTSKTWPHEFRFGSDITYTLLDPKSKSIRRGNRLAKDLSARMPWNIIEMEYIHVDGAPIPQKNIKGSLYALCTPHKQLGTVTVELYCLEKPRRDDTISVTGAEIGEASFKQLSKACGDLNINIPPVFYTPGVSGTIAVPYFKDYATETRSAISPRIQDDPRTPHFIRLLQRIAPDVERKLELTKTRTPGSIALTETMHEVAERLTKQYDDNTNPVFGVGPTLPPTVNPPSPKQEPLFQLKGFHREYEVGETIRGKAHLSKQVTDASLANVQFRTSTLPVKDVQIAGGLIEMTADRVGNAVLKADIPGSGYFARTYFDVVAQRELRISAQHVSVLLGGDIFIFATNLDKAVGELIWDLQGVGELVAKHDSGRVSYKATAHGSAQVVLRDTQNKQVRSICDISVITKVPENRICIRGKWFIYDVLNAGDQPVSMLWLGCGQQNRLMISQDAPAFAEAEACDAIAFLLQSAIAHQFVRLERFEFQDKDPADLDPRDLADALKHLDTEAYKLLAEMLSGKKPKKASKKKR